MIHYKIRHKETGLYHKGGVYDRWSAQGKTWNTLGKLRAMITMYLNNNHSYDFANWEIIEYEVKETAVKSLHEVIKPEKLIKLLQNFK